MSKTYKSGAKCYKIVQNDDPYANSEVNTINKNGIKKFLHYLQTYIPSAQQNFRMFVYLIFNELGWYQKSELVVFWFISLLQIKVQFISNTIVLNEYKKVSQC